MTSPQIIRQLELIDLNLLIYHKRLRKKQVIAQFAFLFCSLSTTQNELYTPLLIIGEMKKEELIFFHFY